MPPPERRPHRAIAPALPAIEEDPGPMTAQAYIAALDPEYRAAAALLPDDDTDWTADPVQTLRASYAAARAVQSEDAAEEVIRAPWQVSGPGGTANGLSFVPPEAVPRAAILYLHGGGWIVGSPETHAVPCSVLSVLSRMPVFAPRYRLAPEHVYPAQRDDAVAAIRGLLSGAPKMPIERLFLVGDSAGAALAFWAFKALQPAERHQVAGIAGIYGVYGLGESASLRRLGPVSAGLSAADIARYRRALTPPGSEQPPNLIAEAKAAGPPVHLLAAALDPVRDESAAFARALSDQGRDVHYAEAAGLPHGFIHFVGRVRSARAALHGVADWIATRTR